jgi:hypothetical protein
MLPTSDLIDAVRADLAFLRSEWDHQVDDHSLRRSSVILRRLLVDNELQRAWKAAGFQREPLIAASTLESVLTIVPLKNLRFASAGGAKYRGAELRGAMHADFAMSDELIKQHFAAGVPTALQGLRSFIEAPCIVVKGWTASRRQVIKYVANKLGGAHHDQKRGKTDEELLFARLDQMKNVRLLDKPAIYFELLSAGQALTASQDVAKFVEP